jgi:molybdopterin converting factor small subunit
VAVTVRIVGDLSRFVQAPSLELQGARYTLGSAVEELVRRNPQLGEQLFDREGRLRHATVLALDGRVAGWPQDRDMVLEDGVEFMLTRFHSGG